MTLMSALGRSAGFRCVRVALQIAEHGPRIDPQIPRRSRTIATISLEDLEDVVPGEVLARLRERDDGALLIAAEVEVVRADQGLVRKHDRLLDAVFELTDIARPVVVMHRF